jgi:predicted transcriptional regulator of viral defense system
VLGSSTKADRLWDVAAAQEGHFTTQQAAKAGYSPQLLAKYLRNGRVLRVRRGVYRLRHFPPGEHEDLVTIWLWSEQAGVFSHDTALVLHGLSDALPARVHLTLPPDWAVRRLRVPQGVVLHHADVPERHRAWVGPVPVTTPVRTLCDSAAAPVSPEVLNKAIKDARARGLLSRAHLASVEAAAKAARDRAA